MSFSVCLSNPIPGVVLAQLLSTSVLLSFSSMFSFVWCMSLALCSEYNTLVGMHCAFSSLCTFPICRYREYHMCTCRRKVVITLIGQMAFGIYNMQPKNYSCTVNLLDTWVLLHTISLLLLGLHPIVPQKVRLPSLSIYQVPLFLRPFPLSWLPLQGSSFEE